MAAAYEYVVRVRGVSSDANGQMTPIDTWLRMRAYNAQDACIQAIFESTSSGIQNATITAVRPFEEDAAAIASQVDLQLSTILKASRKGAP